MKIDPYFFQTMDPYVLYYIKNDRIINILIRINYKGYDSLFRVTPRTFVRVFTTHTQEDREPSVKYDADSVTIWLRDGMVGTIPLNMFDRALVAGMRLIDSERELRIYKTLTKGPYILNDLEHDDICVCGEYEINNPLLHIANIQDMWCRLKGEEYDLKELKRCRDKYSKYIFKIICFLSKWI